jgi:rhodanese-related sulfurtransferase
MKYLSKIFLFTLTCFLTSCLDDNIIPNLDIELNETAKLIQYFESQGDFANSDTAPALVPAKDLFLNLDQYIILDIRTNAEYTRGHIDNSHNVNSSNLYESVDSLNLIVSQKKIVLISKNGQSSSYFTCLLRLAGFNNVFSLSYGMASWHIDFSDDWLQVLGDASDINLYQNTNYPKPALSSLPELEFPNSLNSIKEKAIYRIKNIIKNGFVFNENYLNDLVPDIRNTHLTICYGREKFYNYPPRDLGTLGHPVGTVWYANSASFEFRSTESLQTLPLDKPIIIYSGNGQLSACMAAYLRVIGYKAKTLMFGANQLFYPRLRLDPQLIEDAFLVENIMNYPYVTGN